MKSIKLFFITFVLTFTTSVVTAQELATTPNVKSLRQRQHLSNELSLTAVQQENIYEINQSITHKDNTTSKDRFLSYESKAKSIKENNELRKQLMKNVLTEEQIIKIDSMQKKNQLFQKKHLTRTFDRPIGKN